jgi:hypothetical protein
MEELDIDALLQDADFEEELLRAEEYNDCVDEATPSIIVLDAITAVERWVHILHPLYIPYILLHKTSAT